MDGQTDIQKGMAYPAAPVLHIQRVIKVSPSITLDALTHYLTPLCHNYVHSLIVESFAVMVIKIVNIIHSLQYV